MSEQAVGMNLYQSGQVRELDRIAIDEHGIAGLTLMKRAAEACVDELIERWSAPGQVCVLCGSGNNAADGYIVAGLLASKDINVNVARVGRLPESDTDAGQAMQFCLDAGVEIRDDIDGLHGADLLVDAILGTGLTGAVRPNLIEVIETVNRSGLPVLAVDTPSGLCSDTGKTLGACLKADVTVTFIGRKLGLLTNDGPEYVGELVFSDLGVPEAVYESVAPVARMLKYEEHIQLLEPRHRNAHKMRHGHLLVVGGDRGMAGAAAMAAEAALYTGAGLVSVATHPDNVAAIIARRPELMVKGVESGTDLLPLLEQCQTTVLGPGLGRGQWAQRLFAEVRKSELAMVVDADGLNLLAESPENRTNWILTPHPGEAGRLLGTDAQEDRLASVMEIAQRFGGIALLKGCGTLIASANGKGAVSLCPYGNPGMSVAGMGDVLSGVIGSLLAQGLPLRDAAELGAIIHSLAADRLVASQGERGLLATDLFVEIRRLVNLL
jgi:hydroxyethylthiazole kinase-like uncharacterized protein yjeF